MEGFKTAQGKIKSKINITCNTHTMAFTFVYRTADICISLRYLSSERAQIYGIVYKYNTLFPLKNKNTFTNSCLG